MALTARHPLGLPSPRNPCQTPRAPVENQATPAPGPWAHKWGTPEGASTPRGLSKLEPAIHIKGSSDCPGGKSTPLSVQITGRRSSVVRSFDRYAFGVVAKALARAGVSARADRRDGLVALLIRLLRRAGDAQHVTLCPEVEVRTWRAESAAGRNSRPPSGRTVQRWVRQLELLGLVKLIHNASCTVVVFLFRRPQAQQEEPRQLSAPSLCDEGEAPTELRPLALENPATAGGAPHRAAPAPQAPPAPPQTDTPPTSAGGSVSSGPPQGLREALQKALQASPWHRAARRRAERQAQELQAALLEQLELMPPEARQRWAIPAG